MKIVSAKELGQLVKRVRQVQSLTQAELAAASGVGVRFIVDLEKGKLTCELGKALVIVQMLGIKLEASSPSLEKPDGS